MKSKTTLAVPVDASNEMVPAGLGAQVEGGALLTTSEVLQRLRISRRTLHTHVKRGKLPVIKLGGRTLFHWPSVLQALLRSQREAA